MKITRRTKLLIVALVLCMTTMVGSTLAWFTDEVTSANNVIASGTLKVELYVSDDGTTWTEVKDGSDPIFNYSKWEPGYTTYKFFQVKNAGDLALKFQLNLKADSAITGEYKLADVIDVYTGTAVPTTRENLGTKAGVLSELMDDVDGAAYGMLEAGQTTTMCIALKMQESAGNEYQGLSVGTGFAMQLLATQAMVETDSFGKDYDANAGYGVDNWNGATDNSWVEDAPAGATEYVITTAEQLADLAAQVNAGNLFSGKTIKLGNDIDLANRPWTPIGDTLGTDFRGTFDGQGYTISNLYVKKANNAGLIGYMSNGGNVKNLTVKNAYVEANDYAGAIVGRGYTDVDNCHVENVTVKVNPYLKADGSEYDGGAKAGGVIGQLLEGAGNTVTNCTAKNVTIIGYRDLGGVLGMLHDNNYMADCSAENVEIVYLTVDRYDGNTPNENAKLVVGRVSDSATLEKNVVNTVLKPAIAIETVADLKAFAEKVNGGESYAGKSVALVADIDLKNEPWTPIGTSAHPFKGTFNGLNHTIKNLVVNGGSKSDQGLFGMTTDGEIKNLTVENAKVSGRLDVGVVAGTPYTTKYTNITVKGHVEVNGMSYVGGVGGKNAYANWTDITVNVDSTSYVKAHSIENGKAYRTYVGGVIGFMGEGGHTVKNVTSNIDVIGSTCDVGGIVGIAHYNNNFVNVSCSGNVEITHAEEADEAEEMGGIAGVWHNQNGTTVTFENCSFTGKLTSNQGADLSDNTIVGKAYSETGTGELIIK